MEATEITPEAVETTTEKVAEETVVPTAVPKMEIPEKLNQQQALQVLVDAARISQSKGIFSLDEAELVSKAIKAFLPPTGPVPSNG